LTKTARNPRRYSKVGGAAAVTLSVQIARSFVLRHYLSEPTPCWYCIRFDGMTAMGSCALCSHPACSRVRSSPTTGCSQFERVVGVDDVDWRPAPADIGMPRGLDAAPIEWAP